ncbi:uncharacterized protein EI97DRAFT_373989 [Westerdykella ornata]|uniref:Rhodopsin domain-containing protein n=1 Tax=Westerdykella ornata TaxID=318751 RepID=A0A6A6JQV2_WESOR|nr:uncharacterized protein EI97DRAFT_373989 [Westerdykella ornata]KAF2278076.1 hypothetical protein EI97DRAFT_373989 [Westerdykella ornata]
MKLDQVIVSDTNRTPIVQIITWLCLVTSLLAFLTHAGIKFYVFRALKIESWFVLVSLAFCIAQSIAVIIQCANGYGKPLADLTFGEIQANLQSEYASTILLFASLGFSKLAIGAFVHNLTPSKLHRKINYGIGIVVGLWIICSMLVAAFQCRVPRPWDRLLKERCTDRFAWWNAIAGWNIATELAIVGLELGITAKLHVKRQRKATVMTLFACRLLVLIAAAVQLSFFYKESNDPKLKDDITLGYWRSTTCTQVMQCLAIVTTCLPYTKIFMEGFESGLMRLDDLRRKGEHTSAYSRSRSKESYQMINMSGSKSARSKSTRDRTQDRSAKSIKVAQSWAVEIAEAAESDSSSTKNLRSDGVAHETSVEGRRTAL